MSRTIIFREAAEQELRKAHARYEEKQPGLGDQLLGEVDQALSRVLENPELWAEVHGPIRRALVRRLMTCYLTYRRTEYRLFYGPNQLR